MKSLWKLIAITLAIGFFACACAAPVTAPLSSARALSDVQRIYKNATLVVMGKCMQAHINSDGDTCYDLCRSWGCDSLHAGYHEGWRNVFALFG